MYVSGGEVLYSGCMYLGVGVGEVLYSGCMYLGVRFYTVGVCIWR